MQDISVGHDISHISPVVLMTSDNTLLKYFPFFTSTEQQEMVDGLNGSVLPAVTVVSRTPLSVPDHNDQLNSCVSSLQTDTPSHELKTDSNILVSGRTDARHGPASSMSDTIHSGDTNTVGAMNVSSIPHMASVLPAVSFCLSNTVSQLTSSTIHGGNHVSVLSSNDVISNVGLPDQILQSSVEESCELPSPISSSDNIQLPVSSSVSIISGNDGHSSVGIISSTDAHSSVNVIPGNDAHLGLDENDHSAIGNVSVVPIDSGVVMATCEGETPLLSTSPTFAVSQSQEVDHELGPVQE